MIVPVMAISNLVLTQQIYSEETNGAHAHNRDRVLLNTSCDISKLSQISHNNFEISLVVFMPNMTTNHATTYTTVDSR